MTSLTARFRDAAALAERAAVAHHHAELAGAPADPETIARLQLVADTLNYAAEPLDPPPPFFSRRSLIQIAVTNGVWVGVSTVVLLVVPDPARPWVLAAAVAAGLVASTSIARPVGAIWNRFEIRGLASADGPGELRDAITALRVEYSAITATLEERRDDAHLEAGRRIAATGVWLDAAEQALANTPAPEPDCR